MCRLQPWLVALVLIAGANLARAGSGQIRPEPAEESPDIPERYRYEGKPFAFEMEPKSELTSISVRTFSVRYPSPVVSATPANNTIHAEYFRPTKGEKFPAVIVLDILAGDQKVSRLIATYLAQNGVAALCMHLPYYGPRRPPGSKLRLLSPDYDHSMNAIRQAVLDVRQSVRWLEAQPEVDTARLGILGTSLGSFMASLSAEMEPKLRRVAILLGGGGLVDAYYDHPQGKSLRKVWEAIGGTKERLAQMIAPADPLTYASRLKDRDVLMIAAKRDEIVPPQMAERLWDAAGRPKIVWFDCTHYTAAFFIGPGLEHCLALFRAD